MSRFGQVLADKRILVCVGSGGVGKTTTAAALALQCARQGKNALVVTIDPARRLASSLGIGDIGHVPRRVPDELVGGAGSLHAMMLDQKQAFDNIVSRYASDPEAVGRIIKNPVYAQISGTLAGAQEYAAMAVLHELDAGGKFDRIVVDTPPTAHALDFLDAPEKLSNAIDSPAIEWFRKLRGGGGRGWSVVGRTGSYVLKRLSRFVGSQFLDDLAVFFTEFNDILGGFRQRAEETFSLLREDKVGFVLVASPEAMAIREALAFHRRLLASSMPFAGFVVNKVHEDRPIGVDEVGLAVKIAAAAGAGLSDEDVARATADIWQSHAEIQALAAADLEAIARLREAGGESAALATVPFFREDVHELSRLGRVGEIILSGQRGTSEKHTVATG